MVFPGKADVPIAGGNVFAQPCADRPQWRIDPGTASKLPTPNL
jgi:hypothetical protein